MKRRVVPPARCTKSAARGEFTSCEDSTKKPTLMEGKDLDVFVEAMPAQIFFFFPRVMVRDLE